LVVLTKNHTCPGTPVHDSTIQALSSLCTPTASTIGWNEALFMQNYFSLEVLTAVIMNSTDFWVVTAGTSERPDVSGNTASTITIEDNVKQETSHFLSVVYRFAYSLTLKMVTVRSSETSADFHRTTWRYILECSVSENSGPHQSCMESMCNVLAPICIYLSVY
jgi:hypothetical protein